MAKKRPTRQTMNVEQPRLCKESTDTRDDGWGKLLAKYPDHTALADESIYTLPPRLVELLNRAVPRLFNDVDLAFECDLASTATCGFFRRTSFNYSPLMSHGKKATKLDDLARQAMRSSAAMKDMLCDHMREQGVSEESIIDHFDYESRQITEIEVRRWGYAGWLLTSAEFRRERDQLRRNTQNHYHSSALPSIPLSFNGQSDLRIESDHDEQYFRFLNRWGLQSFATWDLPVPLRPDLATPSLYSLSDVHDAGITLFIPWYLLRDKDIRLSDLADQASRLHLPQSLVNWLNPKPKNWGYKRYRAMLQLYVYLELCLARRYGDRLRGNLSRLDEPFGVFLQEDTRELNQSPDETIRKIRLEMTRRLRSK